MKTVVLYPLFPDWASNVLINRLKESLEDVVLFAVHNQSTPYEKSLVRNNRARKKNMVIHFFTERVLSNWQQKINVATSQEMAQLAVVEPEFELRPDLVVRDPDNSSWVEKIASEQAELVIVIGLPYINPAIYALPKLGVLEYQACNPEHLYGIESAYWALKSGKLDWIQPTVFLRRNADNHATILATEPWRPASNPISFPHLKAHLDFQLIDLVCRTIQYMPLQALKSLQQVPLGKTCPCITLFDKYLMSHKHWQLSAFEAQKYPIE